MVNYKIFKSFGNKRQKNFPLRNKNIYRSEYVSLELNIPLIIEGKIKSYGLKSLPVGFFVN